MLAILIIRRRIVKIAIAIVIIILIIIIMIIIIIITIIIMVIKLVIMVKANEIVVQSHNPKTYICSNSDNAQQEVSKTTFYRPTLPL